MTYGTFEARLAEILTDFEAALASQYKAGLSAFFRGHKAKAHRHGNRQ